MESQGRVGSGQEKVKINDYGWLVQNLQASWNGWRKTTPRQKGEASPLQPGPLPPRPSRAAIPCGSTFGSDSPEPEDSGKAQYRNQTRSLRVQTAIVAPKARPSASSATTAKPPRRIRFQTATDHTRRQNPRSSRATFRDPRGETADARPRNTPLTRRSDPCSSGEQEKARRTTTATRRRIARTTDRIGSYPIWTWRASWICGTCSGVSWTTASRRGTWNHRRRRWDRAVVCCRRDGRGGRRSPARRRRSRTSGERRRARRSEGKLTVGEGWGLMFWNNRRRWLAIIGPEDGEVGPARRWGLWGVPLDRKRRRRACC